MIAKARGKKRNPLILSRITESRKNLVLRPLFQLTCHLNRKFRRAIVIPHPGAGRRKTRKGDMYLVPCPRKSDVKEPARFSFAFDRLRRPRWHLPLIHTHHDDDVEFQALGAVKGNEIDVSW